MRQSDQVVYIKCPCCENLIAVRITADLAVVFDLTNSDCAEFGYETGGSGLDCGTERG